MPSSSAATAGSAHPPAAEAITEPAKPTPETSPQTAPLTPAAAVPAPPPPPAPAADGPPSAAHRSPETAARTHPRPHRLNFRPAIGLRILRRRRHRPRRMDLAPERRQAAHPPVPKLIPHPLDHDVPVIRHHRTRNLLVREIPQHILRRLRVQIMLAGQTRNRHADAASPAASVHQRPDPLPKLQSAVPPDPHARTASSPAHPAPASPAPGRA